MTLEERTISFNFDEDIVLSTCATKLAQQAFESFVPGVQSADGLGKILTQVKDDLPRDLAEDLQYLLNGRTRVQHKKWVFELSNPRKYERVMMRVFYDLCPNWTLKHRNTATQRLQRTVDDQHDEIMDLKRRLAIYERYLPSYDDEHDDNDCDDHYDGEHHKRARYRC